MLLWKQKCWQVLWSGLCRNKSTATFKCIRSQKYIVSTQSHLHFVLLWDSCDVTFCNLWRLYLLVTHPPAATHVFSCFCTQCVQMLQWLEYMDMSALVLSYWGSAPLTLWKSVAFSHWAWSTSDRWHTSFANLWTVRVFLFCCICWLFVKCANSIGYLAFRKLTHTDLNPENILFVKSDKHSRV